MGYSNDQPSMFDDMPKHIADAVVQEISEDLFDSWITGHLDEGVFIADYEMANMCSDDSVKQRFNEYWKVEPGEEYYIEC